jgi:hypothetical protein
MVRSLARLRDLAVRHHLVDELDAWLPADPLRKVAAHIGHGEGNLL